MTRSRGSFDPGDRVRYEGTRDVGTVVERPRVGLARVDWDERGSHPREVPTAKLLPYSDTPRATIARSTEIAKTGSLSARSYVPDPKER